MSPLAHFLLAAAVLHAACAASLPKQHSKLISDIELEDPLDKDAAAPEVVAVAVDQTSVIKDIENNLRAKPKDIPVQVVIEDSQSAIKTNEVADDDEEIKRPVIDLRNPGPPQRQEHETQNADHFTNTQLSTVQETILQTQDLLRQGVKGVGNDISNWLTTNEQMNVIQQNIQSLRDTFTLQIQKLNEVVKGLGTSQAFKPEETSQQTQIQPNLKEVEKRIKILENNFNNGVRALSEGVNIVTILRADDESTDSGAPVPAPVEPKPTQAPPSATTTTPSNQNILYQFMNNFQTVMSDSMRNVTTAMSNALSNVPGVSNFQTLFNPPAPSNTLPPGVQADTSDSTDRPTNNPWTNWQLPFQNLFNGQSQGQAPSGTTPGPIATGLQNIQNAIQNNQIFQNVLGFVRPPAVSTTNTGTVGINVVPPKPYDEKQPGTPALVVDAVADSSAPAAPPAPVAPVGPIRQILSNSPVVQSIAGTVQKIQSSINNPEKPRDTAKSDELETKGGGFHGVGNHNNNNRPSDYGTPNNNSSGLKQENTEPLKEVVSEETKKPEAEEKTPEAVLEKTE